MNHKLIFESNSEEDTENIGFDLAARGYIKEGDIVALCGDLGAGKTAFTRGAARFLVPDATVTSPTFALVNEYAITKTSKLFHFDMYRITTEEDLLSIGFFDFLSERDIIIIEWYENIEDFFDEATVKIMIEKTECDISRKIIYEGL